MEWNCLAYQVEGMWALECYKKALCNFSAFCTESNYCLYTKPPTLSQEGNQESVLSIACYEPGEFIWLTTLTSTLIIPDITKTSSNNCL